MCAVGTLRIKNCHCEYTKHSFSSVRSTMSLRGTAKSGVPAGYCVLAGKGAYKQKSEHCRPRQCDFKRAVCAAGTLRKQNCRCVSFSIAVFRAAHRYVNLSVLLTHFAANISPIRVKGTLFGHLFNFSVFKSLFVSERLFYFRIVEKVVFIQVFFVKLFYIGLCSQSRLFERRFCL